jgi:hypothetical protein
MDFDGLQHHDPWLAGVCCRHWWSESFENPGLRLRVVSVEHGRPGFPLQMMLSDLDQGRHEVVEAVKECS